MLIGCLGSPCSGKTTLSARLFAELKESGITCEFIAEQARYFIAKRRDELGLDSVSLADEDQLKIMRAQHEVETIMEGSIRDNGIVLTDSSPINSLLYMTPEYRDQVLKTYNEGWEKCVASYKFVFVCQPLSAQQHSKDPNRVHDFMQSQLIHENLENLLKTEPFNKLKVHVLGGSSKFRFMEAISKVNSLLCEV